jgi:hypothetical protein
MLQLGMLLDAPAMQKHTTSQATVRWRSHFHDITDQYYFKLKGATWALQPIGLWLSLSYIDTHRIMRVSRRLNTAARPRILVSYCSFVT